MRPTAATDAGSIPRPQSTARASRSAFHHVSGSCPAQPGRGLRSSYPTVVSSTVRPASSRRTALRPLVPTSTPRRRGCKLRLSIRGQPGNQREVALLELLELRIVVHEDPVCGAAHLVDRSECLRGGGHPARRRRGRQVLHEAGRVAGHAQQPFGRADEGRLMAGRVTGRLDRLEAGRNLEQILIDQDVVHHAERAGVEVGPVELLLDLDRVLRVLPFGQRDVETRVREAPVVVAVVPVEMRVDDDVDVVRAPAELGEAGLGRLVLLLPDRTHVVPAFRRADAGIAQDLETVALDRGAPDRDVDPRAFARLERHDRLGELEVAEVDGRDFVLWKGRPIGHFAAPWFVVRAGSAGYFVGSNAHETYLVSRKRSIAYFPPSRPSPDSFMPPKGACGIEGAPSLAPTMPYSRASATRIRREASRVKK